MVKNIEFLSRDDLKQLIAQNPDMVDLIKKEVNVEEQKKKVIALLLRSPRLNEEGSDEVIRKEIASSYTRSLLQEIRQMRN